MYKRALYQLYVPFLLFYHTKTIYDFDYYHHGESKEPKELFLIYTQVYNPNGSNKCNALNPAYEKDKSIKISTKTEALLYIEKQKYKEKINLYTNCD